MSCNPVTEATIESFTGGKSSVEVGIPAGTDVEWCTPMSVQPIERSVVVGDTLWTLSGTVLQANDLDTFTVGPQVRL